MANKNAVLATIVGLIKIYDLKHNGVSFVKVLTDMLCLRVAQMPKSQDLVIFVLTNRQTDR
jgi:hypothetical protein